MKIKFLQKVTLIDYPGKIACTLFLFGCNFRCSFCYNPDLVLKEVSPDLDEEDILSYLTSRMGKLEGVCFTGGEPLMTLSESFLKKVKSLGYSIKIDTNGSFPKQLKDFIDKKLVDYVAMDVKGTKEDYPRITNSSIHIEDIEESMKIISGLREYEFRTTVVGKFHNSAKIRDTITWVSSVIGKQILTYSLQGFKNPGKLIDPSLLEEEDLKEDFLNSIKSSMAETKLVKNINVKI